MMIKRHRLILPALLTVSLLLHVVGLSYPREVVFDEVHFGKFITAYCCTGERFFDIHPPHVKLFIAGVAWLGGYRGGFSFDHIGQAYDNVPVVALRAWPATVGIFLPLVIYVLLRQLGVSRRLAFLGGAAVVLDNALTIQSRVIALDSTLLLATFGSLSAYLAATKTTTMARWLFFILAGALAGLAVGAKFTGLAAPGLLGALVLLAIIKKPTWAASKVWLGGGAVMVLAAVMVYAAGWVVHFGLLPRPGPGDAFHVPQRLLPPEGFSVTGFVAETVKLHRIMFAANYNLAAGHPNASSWWSWPLMQVPVFYWTGQGGQAQLYFVGNPVVWWGTALLFATSVLVTIVQFGHRRRFQHGIFWIPLLGYAVAMLPLMRVPRALFLYHYLTPLLFSLLVSLVWLERYVIYRKISTANLRRAVVVALVVMAVGFLTISPLTYGLNVGLHPSTGASRVQQIMFWLPQSGDVRP